MAVKYTRQFLEQLKKDKILPVYLFSGEDDYSKEEAIEGIEKILFSAGDKELNFNSYLATDISPNAVIDILTTIPFLAEKRLVVVKDIDDWKKKEEEQIIAYLDNPSPNSCLLLTNWKADKKNPLHIKIDQTGLIVNFWNPSEGEILYWMKGRFAKKEKLISTAAAQLLIGLTGNNLSNLNNEIDKICLYAKEKKQIDEQTILSLTAEQRVYQVNELTKILFDNNTLQTLKTLHNLFTENERPEIILGAICQRIRQFIYALSFKKQGLSEEEIAKKLRIYRFYDPNFFRQAKKLEPETLVSFLEYCRQADYEIKTGKQTAPIALEKLVLRLGNAKERIEAVGKT